MVKKNANIQTVGGWSKGAVQKREEDDFYMTDPKAIDCLFAVETFSSHIWENANGKSHLSDRMEQYGHIVKRTDFKLRDDKTELLDFLYYDPLCDGTWKGDIVTNPPFMHLDKWVRLSHMACEGKVALFAQIGMMQAKKRWFEIFENYKLKRLVTFSHRIKCSRDGDFSGGTGVQFSWFVFDRTWKKPTIFNLIGDHNADEILYI